MVNDVHQEASERQLSAFNMAARTALIIAVVELAIMAVLALNGFTFSRLTYIWLNTALLLVVSIPLIIIWVIGPFCIARDRTIAKAENLALYDPLTQLPNRRLFSEHLDRYLAEAKRYNNYAALIYLDLDGFKVVNDRHGHEAGDQILVTTSERLSSTVRAEDTLCRMGGDEFIILVKHAGTEISVARENCLNFASKIRALISKPVPYMGAILTVDCSIGIRILTGREPSSAFALREADLAMYEAKRNNGIKILFANEVMQRSYGMISIGISALDDQHAKVDAMIRQAEIAKTGKTKHFKHIVDALIAHFHYEENFYPEQNICLSVDHIKEHRRLEKLLLRQAEQVTEELADDMLLTLQDILYDHLISQDQALRHAAFQQEPLAIVQ